MGMHQGRLFVSLPGDGVLACERVDPARPQRYPVPADARLGLVDRVNGNDAYVAAGNFGVFDLDLARPSVIPIE